MSTRSSGVGVDINVELVVLCRLVVPEGVSRYRGGLLLRGDRVLEDLRLLAGGMRHLIPIRTQRVQGVKPEHFLCASLPGVAWVWKISGGVRTAKHISWGGGC